MNKRPDGTLVKDISKFQELAFHIMPDRTNSNALFDLSIDLQHTFAYLEKYNDKPKGERITLFEIILAALGRAMMLRPKSNRFVQGRRLFQRNELSIMFVVKKQKTEEGEEINAKILFSPYDTLQDVSIRTKKIVSEARSGTSSNAEKIEFFGRLPRWIIRIIAKVLFITNKINCPIYSVTKEMPMFASVFLTHLGSIDLDAVYHHLYEMGTTSFFISTGKVHKAPIIDQETEEILVHPMMQLRLNIDERVADGIYWVRTVKLLKNFIQNPSLMEEPIDVTDELLDKLKLKYLPEDKQISKR